MILLNAKSNNNAYYYMYNQQAKSNNNAYYYMYNQQTFTLNR